MSTQQDITLGQVLRMAIDARLVDVHTAMPGRVESYDATTQLASVKPLLKRSLRDVDNNEVVEDLPIISDVPVAFPRAGDWFMAFPVAQGNTVLLVFCERNLDQWIERGGDVDPGDLRLHPLDGAVAIPGVYSQPDALTDAHAENLVIGKTGGAQIHIKADGTVNLAEESPSAFVALANLVDTELGNLNSHLTTLKTWLDTHVHPTGVGPSGPPSAPSAAPASPASVAATKVKGV